MFTALLCTTPACLPVSFPALTATNETFLHLVCCTTRNHASQAATLMNQWCGCMVTICLRLQLRDDLQWTRITFSYDSCNSEPQLFVWFAGQWCDPRSHHWSPAQVVDCRWSWTPPLHATGSCFCPPPCLRCYPADPMTSNLWHLCRIRSASIWLLSAIMILAIISGMCLCWCICKFTLPYHINLVKLAWHHDLFQLDTCSQTS